MKILFYNGTPRPIAARLTGHEVTLGNQQWPVVRLYLDRIAAAVNACTPGSYREVEIPFQ